MKRIIDGVTYNTMTSTRLAQREYDTDYANQEFPCTATLYQTRGGAFFVWEEVEVGRTEDNELDLRNRFFALNSDGAQKWIMTGDVEVFHNPFDDPPEAEAEADTSATMYVRLPVTLKQRIEKAAAAKDLSGNAWAIRCLENCLAAQKDDPPSAIGRRI